MATRLEESCKLALVVQTGLDDKGKAVTKTRTFGNIDPDIADADALSVMKGLGSLQKYEVNKMTLTSSCVLTD